MDSRLLTFGRPELWQGDSKTPLGGRSLSRAMALLIFLRVKERGNGVDRQSLAGTLWKEEASDSAGEITRNAVSDLRRLLGDALQTRPSLRISSSLVTCDADQLYDRTKPDREPDDDETLLWYRGDFLTGWTRKTMQPEGKPGHVVYASDFVAWVETSRSSMRARVVRRLEENAALADREKRWDTLDSVTQRLLDVIKEKDIAPRVWLWAIRAATELGRRERAELLQEQFARVTGTVPDSVNVHTGTPHTRSIAESLHGDAISSTIARSGTDVPLASSRIGDKSEVARLGPGSRNRWIVGLAIVLAVVLGLTGVVRTIHSDADAAAVVISTSRICAAGAERATFVRHVYQLNAVLKPGTRFTKGWWLYNNGDCTWGPGVRLRFLSEGGIALTASHADHPIRQTAFPNKEVLISLPMRAPTSGSTYEQWALVDSGGHTIPINGAEKSLLAQVHTLARANPCRAGEESAILVGMSHTAREALISGEPFVGSWSIRNDGGCVWSSKMVLRRRTSGVLSNSIAEIHVDRAIQPGEIATFRVPMRTPDARGNYAERWELDNGEGRIVTGLPSLWFDIVSLPGDKVGAETKIPSCTAGQMAAGWVSESPLDSTVFAPGETFEKVWTFNNTGFCGWDRLTLRFRNATRTRMSAVNEVGLDATVRPNNTHSFVVPMQAPMTPGVYTETWLVRNAQDQPMRVSGTDTVWVTIRVRRR